jgi:hypothetical protein
LMTGSVTHQKTETKLMKLDTPETSEISEAEAARELAKIAAVVDSDDRTAGPIDANELPVSPRLQAEGDVGSAMGCEPAKNERIRQARNALLLTLQMARATGREAVHYSRNRNHYTRFKHNLPSYWTYLNVRKSVDTLISQPDFIREIRVRPQNPASPCFVRRRSALFAGPKFVDAVSAWASIDIEPVTPEQRIIRRDRRKKLLPIPPSQTVNDTNCFLASFDAAIAATHFTFTDPNIRWLAPHLASMTHDGWQYLVNTNRRHLSRIFTGTMDAGGRFYRVFWQDLPKALRSKLLIDGATVAEHDYSACHLRLAHFAMGLAADHSGLAGGGDKYTLDGFGPEWRPQIKRAVQILLNARTIRSAVAAIAHDLPCETWEAKIEVAWALTNGIKKRHAAIAPLWHSGCGLGLQYIDAELTRLCATELLGRGILPLPVHDSMLVRTEHFEDLVEVMERRFEVDGRRLAGQRFKSLRQRGFRDRDLTQGRGQGCTLPPTQAPQQTIDRPVGRSSVRLSDLDLAALSAVFVPGTINIAPMIALPVVVDLKAIVSHFNWIPGGVIRSALLSAAPLYPDRASVVLAVRIWVAKLALDTRATVDNQRLESEVARFIRRKPTPISPNSVARLCGITPAIASTLGLSVVVPTPRKPATTRRAKRMEETLPRVIDVKKAAPWGTASRTVWYAQHPSAATRQVAALRAILSSGYPANIVASREAIKRAKRERSSLSSKSATVADSLLKELDLIMLMHDLGSPLIAIDADDLRIEYGSDRLLLAQCKTSPPSTDRRHMQIQVLAA